MLKVVEDCTTEEQLSVVRFQWKKGLNAKYIHKEMFPVGKCCRANGSQLGGKFSLMTKRFKRR
jgi:hypothetical protein